MRRDSITEGMYYGEEEQTDINFNTAVQKELEELIEKLVRELKAERTSKGKITEEMKRLQKEIMKQEKEMLNKNNKIYQLELDILKSKGNELGKSPARHNLRHTIHHGRTVSPTK